VADLSQHVFRWNKKNKLFLNGPDRKAVGAVFERDGIWRWCAYPAGGAIISCHTNHGTPQEAASGLLDYLEAID
jgi:hypothetical protein